jgi:hypothetical protein
MRGGGSGPVDSTALTAIPDVRRRAALAEVAPPRWSERLALPGRSPARDQRQGNAGDATLRKARLTGNGRFQAEPRMVRVLGTGVFPGSPERALPR